MPFLVVYSSSKKLIFRLYDYSTADLYTFNSYGWQIIAIYRLYKNKFIKKNDFLEFYIRDNNLRIKRQYKLLKIINILELIKNAL